MPGPCRSVTFSDRQESATAPPARRRTFPLSRPFPAMRAGPTLAVVTLLALAGCSEAPTEWRAANPTLDGTELRVEPGAILLETPLEGSELRAVVERHLGDGPGEAGEIGPHWDPRYTSVHLSDATPSSVLGLIESLRRDRGIIFASPCYSFHLGSDSGWGGYIERGYYQPLNGLDILFRE